jgi:acyl carrier protein
MEEMTDVEQDIIEIVRATAPDKCQDVELGSSTNLVDDLGLSSIDMLRILSAIEAHFDVDIFSTRSPTKLRTIEALGRLVAGSA